MTAADLHSRVAWPRLLGAADTRAVRRLAADLAERYAAEDLTLPEAGLGLLKLADGALGDEYFLGEIPVTRAHVRLRMADGRSVEGAAQLLDDRAALVRAVAVLDAVLASRLPGWEEAASLLDEGARRLAEHTEARRALLTHTRVDFSLLGAGEEDDDDA